MNHGSRSDQFAGCLVGQALGDALGFPVEGGPPEVCRRYVEEVLARELMESLVVCQGFDPADYAGRIAALFSEERVVGRGMATDEAARRLARGIPWDEAGTPPPSAGNGTAMRAAPVGLLLFDDPESMLLAAHEQGFITHTDPRCSAGSIAIAGAVALALREGPIEPRPFVHQLADWTRPHDERLAEGLLHLLEWADLAPDEAVKDIGHVGLPPNYRDAWEGISPFVTTSVLWSLYAFLRTPEDYWETICTAIVVGGDVDTTGAMAGAVSGARLGLEAIPENLARQLTDRGAWGYEELVSLAERCHELALAGRRANL